MDVSSLTSPHYLLRLFSPFTLLRLPQSGFTTTLFHSLCMIMGKAYTYTYLEKVDIYYYNSDAFILHQLGRSNLASSYYLLVSRVVTVASSFCSNNIMNINKPFFFKSQLWLICVQLSPIQTGVLVCFCMCLWRCQLFLKDIAYVHVCDNLYYYGYSCLIVCLSVCLVVVTTITSNACFAVSINKNYHFSLFLCGVLTFMNTNLQV